MEKTEFITFATSDVKEILDELNVETLKLGSDEYLLTKDGDIASCENCHRDIKTTNLGNIAHGSERFFCDNPACFAPYLGEKKF